ncbi:type II toxin-antitoxin system Phd/YefM family antitoxin [Candidatus Binatus sp.]|uniref:type II toxin-antitoxin system Phd/YefM family antitoxin n=1 Tax=Candidatus Binatus sp. TaxID=2811406 RepID=UPI003BAFF467
MKSEISATDAARRFSEVVNRVRYRNETFIVKRGGEPVCEIVPVSTKSFTGRELVGLLRSLPQPGNEYLDAVEKHVRRQPKTQKPKRRKSRASRL